MKFPISRVASAGRHGSLNSGQRQPQQARVITAQIEQGRFGDGSRGTGQARPEMRIHGVSDVRLLTRVPLPTFAGFGQNLVKPYRKIWPHSASRVSVCQIARLNDSVTQQLISRHHMYMAFLQRIVHPSCRLKSAAMCEATLCKPPTAGTRKQILRSR